ncbi:MAG: putative beta-lactamase HcpC [Nitrosomonadaceae bacterium]|nr:putative beta-lactamase HcpC [Nitrosomonadaceae bacterium]
MRFLLVALLWLIIFGTVDVASAETPQELTTQCQKGEAAACFNLGYMYGNGTGVTQDDFKAVELYRKACDGQNATGCSNLGTMYAAGTGVTQDDFKAVELYRKACDGKYGSGCGQLGWMYEQGNSVRQSVTRFTSQIASQRQ